LQVAISSDGRRGLVLLGELGRLTLLDLQKSNSPSQIFDFQSPAACMALSGNGRFAVTGDASGAVRVLDLDSRNVVASFHHGNEAVSIVAITENGRRIVSSAGNIKVWDVALPEIRKPRVPRR